MKFQDEHINAVKAAFEKMQNKKDLLNLLNQVKTIIYGDKAFPFELKQLTWFSNPGINKNRYTAFTIMKKSGGERTIHAPVEGLKAIQTCLSYILQCVFDPHKSANGFVRGKSIVDNARVHIQANYVYNIDLENFFTTIEQARVWKCLQLRPFNLLPTDSKEESSKGRLELANMIAAICCTQLEVEQIKDGKTEVVKKNVLPQGAPTSPVITNIVCQRLDFLLSAVAKRFGLRYTRYADDITFSSMHNVYQPGSDFIKELERVISDQGFTMNLKKTRLQKRGYRQEVTGLLVNEKVNIQKRLSREIRMWLYYWEHYGYEKASRFFRHDRMKAGQKEKAGLKKVLDGKINYLGMVRGKEDPVYKKYRNSYVALVVKMNWLRVKSYDEERIKELDILLDRLEADTLDQVLENYKPI